MWSLNRPPRAGAAKAGARSKGAHQALAQNSSINGGDASRIGVKGGCTLFAPARGVSPPLVFFGGWGIMGILGIIGIIGILGIIGNRQ